MFQRGEPATLGGKLMEEISANVQLRANVITLLRQIEELKKPLEHPKATKDTEKPNK